MIEIWRKLRSDNDYEEWKLENMACFMENFADEENQTDYILNKTSSFEIILETHENSLIGAQSSDERNWKLLREHLNEEYSDEFPNIHELAKPTFLYETRRFWFELLKMQENLDYISSYEYMERMWYLRNHAPYKLVNCSSNKLAAILSNNIDMRDIYKDFSTAASFLRNCELEATSLLWDQTKRARKWKKELEGLKNEYLTNYRDSQLELTEEVKKLLQNYRDCVTVSNILNNTELYMRRLDRIMGITAGPIDNLLDTIFGIFPEKLRIPAQLAVLMGIGCLIAAIQSSKRL